ncbi:heterokaryon incompatibility protein, partial [Colletotrichum acutatum]
NLERFRNFKSNHLIKPIAAYEQDQDRCLLFPWAEGGNLAQYWRRTPGASLNNFELAWVFGQLTGLFEALEELHGKNCRHGDLKPENILVFIDADKNKSLQIADMGLTTFHELEAATGIRRAHEILTLTPPGTSRYEPPEMDINRNKKLPAHETRSRAYDIWSMGCVVLELLIWLACGFETVKAFRGGTAYFWEWNDDEKKYCVGSDTRDHITTLATKWQAQSAWRELLELVESRLLVVDVSKDSKSSSPECREIASAAHRQMRGIQEKYYLATRLANSIIVCEFAGFDLMDQRAVNIEPAQKQSQLNDSWESLADNDFASQVLEKIQWAQSEASLTGRKIFCSKCSIVSPPDLFPAEFRPSEAQLHCGLCSILLNALQRVYDNVLPEVVKLRQTLTAVCVDGGPNLLSIYVDPGGEIPRGMQVGLPRLPIMNSPDQFTVLNQWLQSCNTHPECNRHTAQQNLKMPTRLVKVTTPIQLVSCSTMGPKSCQYIALSHCWGQLQKHERFCLYTANHSQLQDHIDFDHLPKTFQDAIKVTRGLGIDYIWIDSLCIIQDNKDDWEKESTKMEEVFSAAYCTISAASARSSLDGFLSNRPPRPSVLVPVKGSPDLYVCAHIDDFQQDVELAEISRRGWVLQERALSRRSIYFTPTQVYWECGYGIRCETLCRLYNSKAVFLGDANFPQSALDHYRDGRQLLIQDLHERYSALAFTKASDRAVAILGLQTRLARALQTQAAHGSFEKYFARGILWKRDQVVDMTAITQSTWLVPTWSWFSKTGKIQYMNLEFDKIEWANEDFESPFSRHQDMLSGSSYYGRDEDYTILRGIARRMDVSEQQIASEVCFDRKNKFKAKDLRAVIIGRDKKSREPKVHVLVICQSQGVANDTRYERVGVASFCEKQVSKECIWVDIY